MWRYDINNINSDDGVELGWKKFAYAEHSFTDIHIYENIRIKLMPNQRMLMQQRASLSPTISVNTNILSSKCVAMYHSICAHRTATMLYSSLTQLHRFTHSGFHNEKDEEKKQNNEKEEITFFFSSSLIHYKNVYVIVVVVELVRRVLF